MKVLLFVAGRLLEKRMFITKHIDGWPSRLCQVSMETHSLTKAAGGEVVVEDEGKS